MTKYLRTFGLLALALSAFSGCENLWGPPGNASDPNGTAYQGYTTVETSSEITPGDPEDGGLLSSKTLTFSKVAGATAYQVRIADSSATIDSAPVFTSSASASNAISLDPAPLAASKRYFWKARAKRSGAWDRSWSRVFSFSTSADRAHGASISLLSPTGTLKAGNAGSVAYPASTSGVAKGTAGTVVWYGSAAGTTVASKPSGIAASVTPVSDDAATVTIAADASLAAGEYYFKLKEGTALSPLATLKAVASGYFVTFDANGGSGSMLPQVIEAGKSAALFKNGFAPPAGCAFAGWTTNKAGAGKSYAEGVAYAMGGSDATLYAVWLPTSISFSSSGNQIKITDCQTSVTGALAIPCGVTAIGDSSFSGCNGLSGVTIPVSVTTLGAYAFRNCYGMSTVAIPSSVSSIGGNAFNGCSGLTNATISDGVASIGNRAFYYCTGLTSVTIPASVISIGSYAFAYCSGLTSATISPGVASIGEDAFSSCSKLASVTIPSSVAAIGASAFYYCTSLKSATISSGVASIGNYAFYCCNGLTSVSIPSSVVSIGISAFYYCTSLTSATISPGVASIGNAAFYNCSGLASISIPTSVAAIGDGTFYDCTSLSSVTISEGVASIGKNAFYYCSSLTSVSIPSSVILIDDSAFMYCNKLTGITLSPGITSIKGNAFACCTKISSVTLPSTITSMGPGVFSVCSSLKSCYMQGNSPPTVLATSSLFSNVDAAFVLYVPSASLDDYAAATGWSVYASKMQGY